MLGLFNHYFLGVVGFVPLGFLFVFRHGLLAVPDIICLIKKYCEVVLNKTCCELNPSDSVIPVVTYKLISYVRYRMHTL